MSSNGQPGFQVASHRLGYDSVISCTARHLKPQSGNASAKQAATYWLPHHGRKQDVKVLVWIEA